MYFGAIAPLRPMPFHPGMQPRPFVPPPRVITREVIVRQPPRVITREVDRYHTVYQPGPVRTIYQPGPTQTIVRPDYGAIQRARAAQANWDREHFQLERLAMRDQIAAARLAMLQQQLAAAQAAAAAAAQQPIVQTPLPPTIAPTLMPQPQPSVSPASPAVDLTPTQDAAAAAEGGGQDAGGGEESVGHKPKHLVLFVGLIAVAGIGGYMLMKKKKGPKKSSSAE